jgi:hypothetical protein
MRRYVYMVVVVPHDIEPGVTKLPNLGAHFSFRKACRHYENVVKCRGGEFRCRLALRNFPIFRPDERYTRMFTWWNDDDKEEVVLERWVVR